MTRASKTEIPQRLKPRFKWLVTAQLKLCPFKTVVRITF